MHQNTLMWSRLRILWFIQLGFLALAGYLFFPHQAPAPTPSETVHLEYLAKFIALLCAFTTFGLWIVMRTDKLIRDIYRRNIEVLNLGFFPASLGQKPIDEDNGTLIVEPIFYGFIYTVFVGIDLYASSVFGLKYYCWLSMAFLFLLASLILSIVERTQAKKTGAIQSKEESLESPIKPNLAVERDAPQAALPPVPRPSP